MTSTISRATCWDCWIMSAVERAVFAGLDFGAFAMYDFALRHPDRVMAVIGLENPAAPHNPDESPLTEYRRMGEQHFMHIEYFRVPPRADEELAAQPRRFFHKVFHTLSGAGNYFDCFKHPPQTSYIDAMAEAAAHCPGLGCPNWSWNFFVSEYSRSGFTGGLNWYPLLRYQVGTTQALRRCAKCCARLLSRQRARRRPGGVSRRRPDRPHAGHLFRTCARCA